MWNSRLQTLQRTTAAARPAGIAALAALLLAHAVPTMAATSIEAVDPDHFRVCAEPDNLPFSNKEGQGFHNKIAELFAKDLGRPLVYVWHPMSGSFFMDTLDMKACDIAMGVPAGLSAVLNTNPYYRMTYVMVYPKDSGIKATSLSDPIMKKLKIGTVAGTPPNFLLAENDLLKNMRGYQLVNAAQSENVGKQMIDDLKSKAIDVALMAGPVAGYWLKQEKVDAVMIPLPDAKRKGGRMDYLITMGVRHGEDDWKHQINDVIRKDQDKINAILTSYGVPILKMVGPPTPVSAKAGASESEETHSKAPATGD